MRLPWDGSVIGRTPTIGEVSNIHTFGPVTVTIDDASVVRCELAIDARCDDPIGLEDLLKRTVSPEVVLVVAGAEVVAPAYPGLEWS